MVLPDASDHDFQRVTCSRSNLGTLGTMHRAVVFIPQDLLQKYSLYSLFYLANHPSPSFDAVPLLYQNPFLERRIRNAPPLETCASRPKLLHRLRVLAAHNAQARDTRRDERRICGAYLGHSASRWASERQHAANERSPRSIRLS